jgi:hypothetical protein
MSSLIPQQLPQSRTFGSEADLSHDDASHLLGDGWTGMQAIRYRGEVIHQYVCTRHQWASRWATDPADVIPVCPLCDAERDHDAGRLRYRMLHDRLAAGFR